MVQEREASPELGDLRLRRLTRVKSLALRIATSRPDCANGQAQGSIRWARQLFALMHLNQRSWDDINPLIAILGRSIGEACRVCPGRGCCGVCSIGVELAEAVEGAIGPAWRRSELERTLPGDRPSGEVIPFPTRKGR